MKSAPESGTANGFNPHYACWSNCPTSGRYSSLTSEELSTGPKLGLEYQGSNIYSGHYIRDDDLVEAFFDTNEDLIGSDKDPASPQGIENPENPPPAILEDGGNCQFKQVDAYQKLRRHLSQESDHI
ncbi:hypothetical protein E4U41_000798 [Claviceps citrina]|nr:hypothetical protein E4U41_000798 [Claviceps citrina]